MPDDDLTGLVNDIYTKTHRLWWEARPHLGQHDHGFKILYAPARAEPAVLIIGLQPGGDGSNMLEAEQRHPSANNEYLDAAWPLACKLRGIFDTAYLQDAIGTNAIYFRAPNWAQKERGWCKIDRSIRTPLADFCIHQNKHLINAMRPKQILLLGWEALKLMGGSKWPELVAKRPSAGRKRLLKSGTIEGIPAFAIPHPSAAWRNPPVTAPEWAEIVRIIIGCC